MLLHAVCSGLFTRIALAVVGLQMRFAALAGVLFASHPIHTEAVAGIVGRADVLACFFFILSFLAYHDYSWRCNKRILLSCIFASAGLLAKETGITVLLVNLIYDLYVSWAYIKKAFLEMRWNEESMLFCKRLVPLSIAIIILIALRLALLQGSFPKFSNQDNPAAFHPLPSVRFLTYSYLTAFNFWLLLFPFTLSHDWQMGSIPLITNILDQRNVFTCLFFLFFCWIVYKILIDFEYQRHGPMIIGFLFLMVPFLPASNILVTVGFVVAERILYIPSMGVILLVVYGGQILSHKFALIFHKSWPVTISFSFLIILYVSRTMLRNQDWRNRESLLKSGLSAVPTNSKMHYNWANYQRENGQPELSLFHYREALRLWPSYASAHNNLGTLVQSATEAEAHFLAAIKYSPNHVNAHYNLGHVYRKMNKTEHAVLMLQKCIRLNANYVGAYLLLSKLYEGHIAGRLLKHITKLQPTNPNYFMYYAQWLHRKHRLNEAIYNHKMALRLCSSHQNSFIGLIHVYRDIGYFARLHQLLIRWHIHCRRKNRDNSRIIHTGDLYLRGWDMYKQGQGTLLRELPVMHPGGHVIKCNKFELAPMLIPVEGGIKNPNVGTSPVTVPSAFGESKENGFFNPG